MLRRIMRWTVRTLVLVLLALAVGVMSLRHIAHNGTRLFYLCGRPLQHAGKDYYLGVACNQFGEIVAHSGEFDDRVMPGRYVGLDRFERTFYFGHGWGPPELEPLSLWSFGPEMFGEPYRRFYFDRQSNPKTIEAGVPDWSLASLLTLPAFFWLLSFEFRILRNARKRRRKICLGCGYDLRATLQRCPECGLTVDVNRTTIQRWSFVLGPTAAIAALFILVILGYFAATPLWLKINFNRWSAPSGQEYADLSAPYQHVVQAIYDYRAERHILPVYLDDLKPAYLEDIPKNIDWYEGHLDIAVGLNYLNCLASQTVDYDFGPNDEGWKSRGDFGEISLPSPRMRATKPVTSEARSIELRLVDFDARIAAGDSAIRNYAGKICLLVNQDRIPEALRACRQAAEANPDWWFPQMVMAEYSLPRDADASVSQFANWADQHPTFFHYWCLARACRDRGRQNDAFAALGHAVNAQSMNFITEDSTRFGIEYFCGDAILNAYQNHRYQLAIDLCNYRSKLTFSKLWYELQSASELALGQFDAAKADSAFAASEDPLTPNLDKLQAAINAKDYSFILDQGHSSQDWKLISSLNREEWYDCWYSTHLPFSIESYSISGPSDP